MSGVILGFLAGMGSYLYLWLNPKVYYTGDGLLPWIALSALFGSLLGFCSVATKLRLAISLVAGAVFLNLLRLAIEMPAHPESHNLFPLELAATLVLTAVGALPGTLVGRLARRLLVSK